MCTTGIVKELRRRGEARGGQKRTVRRLVGAARRALRALSKNQSLVQENYSHFAFFPPGHRGTRARNYIVVRLNEQTHERKLERLCPNKTPFANERPRLVVAAARQPANRRARRIGRL